MVETEHTPNPDTLKFLPGKKVSEVGPIEFLKNDKSIKVSLANKILSLEGTVMVFFGEDFITVKKEKDLNWENLKHGIISEINEYYSKGNKVVVSKDLKLKKILNKSTSGSQPLQSDKIIDKINEILDSKIRPAVAKDGGDIKFKSFNNGIVTGRRITRAFLSTIEAKSSAALNERSIRDIAKLITSLSTFSCLSENNFNNTAARTLSSGKAISVTGKELSLELKSANFIPHLPGGVRAQKSMCPLRSLIRL